MSQIDLATETPLEERVSCALERNPRLANRDLRFETADGQVTLRGSVRTYYEKQMAQESLRRIDGIQQINNELVVTWA